MLSSAIQVRQFGTQRLEIICPPYLAVAWIGLVVVVISVVVTLLMSRRAIVLIMLTSSLLPVLIFTLVLGTTWAKAVFDRGTGTVRVERRTLGISFGVREFPLSTVQTANLVYGKQTVRVTLFLKDGSTVPVGFLTNQGGQSAATKAINQFLQ